MWQVSSLLMKKLGLEIPQFQLRRTIIISATSTPSDHVEVGVWLVGVVSFTSLFSGGRGRSR